MSLASRLVNLFIPSQAPQLAPSDGSPVTQFDLTPHHGIQQSQSVPRGPRREESSQLWIMEEEETEGRPPYLHVRWINLSRDYPTGRVKG